MREYLLLLLIAFTGLSGLISIHRDVKIQSQQELILYRQDPQTFGPQPHSAAIETNHRLAIFQGESWSDVQFHIKDFRAGESFTLDVGDGTRLILKDAVTKINYQKPGTYYIKLFRDSELIEANEIELLDPEVTL